MEKEDQEQQQIVDQVPTMEMEDDKQKSQENNASENSENLITTNDESSDSNKDSGNQQIESIEQQQQQGQEEQNKSINIDEELETNTKQQENEQQQQQQQQGSQKKIEQEQEEKNEESKNNNNNESEQKGGVMEEEEEKKQEIQIENQESESQQKPLKSSQKNNEFKKKGDKYEIKLTKKIKIPQEFQFMVVNKAKQKEEKMKQLRVVLKKQLDTIFGTQQAQLSTGLLNALQFALNQNNINVNMNNRNQNAQQRLKDIKLFTPFIKNTISEMNYKRYKKKMANKKPGIEIFVDIDGTLFNDPSVHAAILAQIKKKRPEKYLEFLQNSEFLDSVVQTENLMRPNLDKLIHFFYQLKQSLPFVQFSIFTSNKQIKTYEHIIKQYVKNIQCPDIFTNYVLAQKTDKQPNLVKDIEYSSDFKHCYIIDNNNTCRSQQIANLIPVKTYEGIEYLTDKARDYYLQCLSQLELDVILQHKNEKHLTSVSDTNYDWNQDINNIINQIQIIVDSLMNKDESLLQLLQ